MRILILPLPEVTHLKSFLHLIKRLGMLNNNCTLYIKEEHEYLVKGFNVEIRYYDDFFLNNIFGMNENLKNDPNKASYDREKFSEEKLSYICGSYMASYAFRVRCMKKYLKKTDSFSSYDVILYDYYLAFGDFIGKKYNIPCVTLMPTMMPIKNCRDKNLEAFVNMKYFTNICDDTLDDIKLKNKLIESIDHMSESITDLTNQPYDFFESGISKLNIFSTTKEIYPYEYDEDKAVFVGRGVKDPNHVLRENNNIKKKVMVYFGKIVTEDQKEMFRCVLINLVKLPYEVHVAVKNRKEEEYIDEDIKRKIYLDERLAEVLPEMDIYICHGGLGGLQEGIMEGVPVIGIGSSGERYENSKRIDQLGIGKSILPCCEAINKFLNDTVEEVLKSEKYKKACMEYSRSLTVTDGDLDDVISKIRSIANLKRGEN